MVLAYGLLKERRTIDVIISKFFPLCLKMAESFENSGNILRDWANDKVQNSFAEVLNSIEKQEEERWSRFFQKLIQKKILEQS